LFSLYQIFIFLLGHLHFFLDFFFTFMENLFKKHPIHFTDFFWICTYFQEFETSNFFNHKLNRQKIAITEYSGTVFEIVVALSDTEFAVSFCPVWRETPFSPDPSRKFQKLLLSSDKLYFCLIYRTLWYLWRRYFWNLWHSCFPWQHAIVSFSYCRSTVLLPSFINNQHREGSSKIQDNPAF